ncbi:PLP-dependent transferase [Ramaria rubella]|nr:PLP-dependent transferase [Ramaria rubella]
MRKALVDEMKVVYGDDADITDGDVSLTAGCNMAYVAVATTLAEPGDEMIIPVPWYFNHQMVLQTLGVRTVPLQCHASEGFLPSVSECNKLITSRTRAIVLVTPNNPTGAIYPPDLLCSFAKLAKEHDVALVVDETYRDLVPSGLPHRLFSPAASTMAGWEWRANFIHLFSFSKSYCVPGHRLGAVVASPEFLDHVNTVLDNIQICPPRPIQMALHPLLSKLRPFIRASLEALLKRHEVFKSILPPGWIVGSHGAYYAFVQHPLEGVSALDVSMKLAKEFGVATLPASFFTPNSQTLISEVGAVAAKGTTGNDRWIRFSIANVDENSLRKVAERLLECEQSFRMSN